MSVVDIIDEISVCFDSDLDPNAQVTIDGNETVLNLCATASILDSVSALKSDDFSDWEECGFGSYVACAQARLDRLVDFVGKNSAT